jgi:phosphoribosyl 1,2-cyclic phosphodiesterase
MSLNVHFLASGSRGNCTLVEYKNFRFLIDIGIGIRKFNDHLFALGVPMESISAVILTHTHNDHVKDSMLCRMAKSSIPLFCHHLHDEGLMAYKGYRWLKDIGGVRFNHFGSAHLHESISFQTFEINHDVVNQGFLFDLSAGSAKFRFMYAADCGRSSMQKLREAMTGVNLLALEFNHDETMEKESGRPWFLIDRVLGPNGHLSNKNAAGILADADCPELCSLIQLHLSKDCNNPSLANDEARKVLPNIPIFQGKQEARESLEFKL